MLFHHRIWKIAGVLALVTGALLWLDDQGNEDQGDQTYLETTQQQCHPGFAIPVPLMDVDGNAHSTLCCNDSACVAPGAFTCQALLNVERVWTTSAFSLLFLNDPTSNGSHADLLTFWEQAQPCSDMAEYDDELYQQSYHKEEVADESFEDYLEKTEGEDLAALIPAQFHRFLPKAGGNKAKPQKRGGGNGGAGGKHKKAKTSKKTKNIPGFTKMTKREKTKAMRDRMANRARGGRQTTRQRKYANQLMEDTQLPMLQPMRQRGQTKLFRNNRNAANNFNRAYYNGNGRRIPSKAARLRGMSRKPDMNGGQRERAFNKRQHATVSDALASGGLV